MRADLVDDSMAQELLSEALREKFGKDCSRLAEELLALRQNEPKHFTAACRALLGLGTHVVDPLVDLCIKDAHFTFRRLFCGQAELEQLVGEFQFQILRREKADLLLLLQELARKERVSTADIFMLSAEAWGTTLEVLLGGIVKMLEENAGNMEYAKAAADVLTRIGLPRSICFDLMQRAYEQHAPASSAPVEVAKKAAQGDTAAGEAHRTDTPEVEEVEQGETLATQPTLGLADELGAEEPAEVIVQEPEEAGEIEAAEAAQAAGVLGQTECAEDQLETEGVSEAAEAAADETPDWLVDLTEIVTGSGLTPRQIANKCPLLRIKGVRGVLANQKPSAAAIRAVAGAVMDETEAEAFMQKHGMVS